MRFNVILPLSFKVVDALPDEEPKGGAVHNTQQCTDFKLKEDELWTQFAGLCLTNRAKLNGTIMCMRWHSSGCCFNDCKNKASHVACSEIPAEAKQAHLKWMKTVHGDFK
jgi:hypothetical protein